MKTPHVRISHFISAFISFVCSPISFRISHFELHVSAALASRRGMPAVKSEYKLNIESEQIKLKEVRCQDNRTRRVQRSFDCSHCRHQQCNVAHKSTSSVVFVHHKKQLELISRTN